MRKKRDLNVGKSVFIFSITFFKLEEQYLDFGINIVNTNFTVGGKDFLVSTIKYFHKYVLSRKKIEIEKYESG